MVVLFSPGHCPGLTCCIPTVCQISMHANKIGTLATRGLGEGDSPILLPDHPSDDARPQNRNSPPPVLGLALNPTTRPPAAARGLAGRRAGSPGLRLCSS